jgi:hypothetical protein
MGAGFTNSVFGGLKARTLYRNYYHFVPSSFSDAFAEKTITLATPVDDYTKCVVLVKGVFPYLVGFTLNPYLPGQVFPSQIVYTEAYARMTDNSTIKLKLAWNEPVVGDQVGNYSTDLVTSGYVASSFLIEVIELKGLKSLTYQEIINTNVSSYLNPGSAPAGVNHEKCIVIYQGGFMLMEGSKLEYKTLNGGVSSGGALDYDFAGPMFGTGGGSFASNRRLGVYILETW